MGKTRRACLQKSAVRGLDSRLTPPCGSLTSPPAQFANGGVAKWEGRGLQNLYERVRLPPPPRKPGARLGARLVITRGTWFIRPVFLAVAVALAAKLLWASVRG